MRSLILTIILLGVAACTETTGPGGADVYRIANRDTGAVQFRMLDSVNALRGAEGLPQLELSAELIAAAATHSKDMSLQNRPWNFGSDGSNFFQRVARTGYPGTATGEVISESYETELETLAAWMENPEDRVIIMDPRARAMGFSWFQE
ncbi:MAG: CAP domain-containing protein, partial [Pseudomonadota bacterium]